jgi:hypothetical protein
MAFRDVPLEYNLRVGTKQHTCHIRSLWGITWRTERIHPAVTNLPPTVLPFALQAAVRIPQWLPRPSRGGLIPFLLN